MSLKPCTPLKTVDISELTIIIDDELEHSYAISNLLNKHNLKRLALSQVRTELGDLAKKNPGLVLIADFSRSCAAGWEFASATDRDEGLFPIGVIGVAPKISLVDPVFCVIDVICPPFLPRNLLLAIENTAMVAQCRHRQWQRALRSIKTVRAQSDDMRKHAGLPAITDEAWNRACLVLCRASLDHGDDWQTEALALLTDIFHSEM